MKAKSVAILVILVGVAIGAFYYKAFPFNSRPVGIMRVFAWYATLSGVNGEYIGSYKIVFISVSGPQSTSGATTTDPRNPLMFGLTPGTYNVSGTYDPVKVRIFKSVNVTVVQGETVDAFLNFGGPPPP
jgi:hypothetical protein